MKNILDIFTPEVIEHYKNNKQEITPELLQSLRDYDKDDAKKGKQIAFDILDMDKDLEQHYLDAFGNRLTHNGIRNLKKPFTQLNLSEIHQDELKKCANDLHYFKDNYVKIKTRKGVNYPDLRNYQNEFLEVLLPDEHEQIVGLMGRQCCDSKTVLETSIGKITFEELFETIELIEDFENLNIDKKEKFEIIRNDIEPSKTSKKYIKSLNCNHITIKTDEGFKNINSIHKTVPYRKYKIELENGLFLECAYNHVIIDENYQEVYAKDSLNKMIQTAKGISKVINVIDLQVEENMYDISIDYENELYYSNDILSHNSGKSVSVAIYASWLYTFKKDINIGIVAQKGSTSREFLSKIKEILIELPIWMQQGTKVWNKGSIENEIGNKVLTDIPSVDSFRGFSINCLIIDECVHGEETITIRDIKNDKILKIKISDFYILYNEDLGRKNKFEVLTSNGFQNFEGIKRTKHNSSTLITFEDLSNIRVSNNHEFYINGEFISIQNLNVKDKINDKIIKSIEVLNHEPEYFYDLLEVHGGNHYTTSDVESSNCAFIKTNIYKEFEDSIFPTQSALSWKKNIIISTANGMNHFYDIVEKARNNISGSKIVEVDWKEVPRYDSKGNMLTNEQFKKSILDKHGVVYFNQNYANAFIGSSNTLLDAEILKNLKAKDHIKLLDDKLKIYEEPKDGHNYIMSCDTAKDGTDNFSIQIIDITSFKFKQVACAKLQIDYLLMPEFVSSWGEYYNNAYLIIENNEGSGQSIADQLKLTWEYENLHYDRGSNGKRKEYPGFRTHRGNRSLLLNTLKLFAESHNLEIVDQSTISEFNTFIQINGKFQADYGYHDDMIMSLALIFAPFARSKNFEDMKKILDGLYKENEYKFIDYISFGDFENNEVVYDEHKYRGYDDYGYLL